MRILLFMLPFITFFSGYVGTLLYVHTKTVQVPTIVGKSLHAAASILGRQNLALKLLNVKEDSFLPDGTVLSQFPAPQQKIKPAKAVFVVITKKPQPFLIPPLFGKSYTEMKESLKDSYISLKVVTLPRNDKAGLCFAQYPGNGCEVFDHKAIAYCADNKNNVCVMPNLVGLPLQEVEDLLKSRSINYEIFKFFHKSSRNDLIVSDQKPMAGTILNVDDRLHIQLRVDLV